MSTNSGSASGGWRKNPWVSVGLLFIALSIWGWNFVALLQQGSIPIQDMELAGDLPTVPKQLQPMAALPHLERDPFLLFVPKPVVEEPVAEVVTTPVETKPAPPPPPPGRLMMVLNRQDEYAAIFRFGRGEPEVFMTGDEYQGWKVMLIRLDHVLWRHEASETDYVSEMP